MAGFFAKRSSQLERYRLRVTLPLSLQSASRLQGASKSLWLFAALLKSSSLASGTKFRRMSDSRYEVVFLAWPGVCLVSAEKL
ncbi:MAG: hypothetical protein KDD59_09680 [Bdellovibrionales bacterium]|nr:hypothetical protein [Bdellovibrionales bacterium]